MKGISIILCCYNSAKRLPETLTHLAKQKVSATVNWEVIVVDNNSTDTTAILACNLWESLGAPSSFQIVEEPQPGLSFARERGMSAANNDIFLFCDDDNWLRHDYIENVFRIFEINPKIGALGGWSKPVFEDIKPEFFDTFSGNFAVGKPIKKSGLLKEANHFIYGAGMALRKETIAHLKKKGFKSILSDRKGTQLSSGGDVELIYGIKLLGVPVMFNEELFFYHYMPNSRISWEYLVKLRKSMYWSNFVLGIYIDCLKCSRFTVISMVKKILKAIKYIYTKQKQLKTMDSYNTMFLKNQIEVRKLFLNHLVFYCKTRISLSKIHHG